jgi:hypothetical protein
VYSAFAKKFFLYSLAVADLEEFITSFRGASVCWTLNGCQFPRFSAERV